MKACCCSLPLINPNACKNCGNYSMPDDFNVTVFPFTVMPLTTEEKLKLMPNTAKKEIIEKYDKDGKLIEKITREI